jgi:hypothetical protein
MSDEIACTFSCALNGGIWARAVQQSYELMAGWDWGADLAFVHLVEEVPDLHVRYAAVKEKPCRPAVWYRALVSQRESDQERGNVLCMIDCERLRRKRG